MIALIPALVLVSMLVFTMFGRFQRWPWKLSMQYGGTMTIFLSAVIGASMWLMSAVPA